jgi:hypothetical protein
VSDTGFMDRTEKWATISRRMHNSCVCDGDFQSYESSVINHLVKQFEFIISQKFSGLVYWTRAQLIMRSNPDDVKSLLLTALSIFRLLLLLLFHFAKGMLLSTDFVYFKLLDTAIKFHTIVIYYRLINSSLHIIYIYNYELLPYQISHS